MDNLQKTRERKIADRGVAIDLPAKTGFKWMEFWKSDKTWKIIEIASGKPTIELTLSKDEVSAFAREGIMRRVLLDYAAPATH